MSTEAVDPGPEAHIQVRGLNQDARDRIRKAIFDCDGPKAFAAKSGIPLSTLNQAMSGRSEPKAGLLAAIAEAASVSLDWLVFGREVGVEIAPSSPSIGASAPEVLDVPFYDIRVSAGPGAIPLTEEPAAHIGVNRQILGKLGLRASDCAVFTVSGDSAEPTMSDGDYVMVDLSAKELRNGGMYVIGIDDDVVVKRVERLVDGSVRLRSDNPNYSPQVVSTSDVDRLRVIGRVRWAVHQF